MNTSFEERVKNEVIAGAKLYKSVFLDYDYLICSRQFKNNAYYTISAYERNFLHLTGVQTKLKAVDFFDKCLNGSLQINDFYIKDKGTVRHKIQVLPGIDKFFSYGLLAQEDFNKNKVKCTLAGTDLRLTIGFIDKKECVPMTLLKGNELDHNSPIAKVEFVMCKRKTDDLFDKIIIGNNCTLKYYHGDVKHLLSNGYLTMY